MNKTELLRNKLKLVKDSYEDFLGVADDVAEYNGTDLVLDYLEKHRDSTTSDVILFVTEEIFGIKPLI